MKIAAAALAGAAATGAAVSPVAAATAPVSNARVLIYYSLAAGDRPENVTAVPGGDFYDTLSKAAQVEGHAAGRAVHSDFPTKTPRRRDQHPGASLPVPVRPRADAGRHPVPRFRHRNQ
jgi:hypothetical protein